MPRNRHELESWERKFLAPYAQLSSETRGREHEEEPPLWRTHYQRDRDRVIHSRAFRRLEYKTQVFLNGTGDHLRTRLTHTMEVAAISRNIARPLCLNEDLAEAIALAHDLGHPPFGHKGEEALNRLMEGHGGFEHNQHSLRIVQELEHKYPNFSGLNLTWEVREGLSKHYNFEGGKNPIGFEVYQPSLEAQVANIADEITYYSHDLDDGLDTGLLDEAKLNKEVRVWNHAAKVVEQQHGLLPDECRRYFTIRTIIDEELNYLIASIEKRLADANVKHVDDVRRTKERIVQYDDHWRTLNAELRQYLYDNLYYNPAVHEPNSRAVGMLEALFKRYVADASAIGTSLPPGVEKHRAICDHIAGMTDRYVVQEHQRLFANS
jgi:dGTPase